MPSRSGNTLPQSGVKSGRGERYGVSPLDVKRNHPIVQKYS